MRKAQMLSGADLVAKGATKQDTTLPEIGLKDVIPNGSWLEQKQIQAAIEARKHLVEVPRIEKHGVLSQGEWVEELGLVKVTHHVGGHWRYIGHVRNKQIYLKPEEALYLMETNALQLKYEEVSVSLQQAYSLLLQGKVTLFQYKVYASLSRLGYKILRHGEVDVHSEDEEAPLSEYEIKMNLGSYKKVKKINNLEVDMDCADNENKANATENKITNDTDIAKSNSTDDGKDNVVVVDNPNVTSRNNNEDLSHDNNSSSEPIDENMDQNTGDITETEEQVNKEIPKESTDTTSEPIDENMDQNTGDITETEEQVNKEIPEESTDTTVAEPPKTSYEEILSSNNETNNLDASNNKEIQAKSEIILSRKDTKLQGILKRKYKIISRKKLDKFFENIPEMCQNQVVTLNVPEEIYLPRNVFLNNTRYVIDLEAIRKKAAVGLQNETRTYTLSDEVNAAHVGRIRSSNTNATLQNNSWAPQYTPSNAQNGFPRFQQPRWFPFGPRPRHLNTNFLFNFVFQRPFMPPHMGFPPRFQFFPRHQIPFYPRQPRIVNWNNQNQTTSENSDRQNRKRSGTSHRTVHLETIKGLAIKLKQLIQNGTMHQQNVVSLQSLINTYNIRYRAKLRIDDDLNLIDEEVVVDTIELDDDEPESKKPRQNSSSYEDNLQAIKQLAQRLKDLEAKGKATSRHRRVFSTMVNNFNKSYKSEICYDNHYEVIDKRQIVVDSSDSDCILDEAVKINKNDGKKYINPFSIFRKLSVDEPSTSKTMPSKYAEISKVFNKNWLPPEDDFGKPEVISKKAGNYCLKDSRNEEYFLEFIKNYQSDYKNWLDVKLSFWESIDDTPAEIPQDESVINADLSTNSLVKPEDCKNMASVLEKLRIIQTCKGVNSETSLLVDFDVWSRDVPQFRKTDKPTPHFRILCIDEKNGLPSGADIQTLYSQYPDEVPIVFAVVGIGSISYLQMKPNDLPVHIPSSDLTLSRVFVG